MPDSLVGIRLSSGLLSAEIRLDRSVVVAHWKAHDLNLATAPLNGGGGKAATPRRFFFTELRSCRLGDAAVVKDHWRTPSMTASPMCFQSNSEG